LGDDEVGSNIASDVETERTKADSPLPISSSYPQDSKMVDQEEDSYGVSLSAVLTTDDLSMLFSGAPKFELIRRPSDEILEEDQFRFEPVVTFPFGGGGTLTDYRPPGHPAFGLCTSRNKWEEGLVKEVPAMYSFMGTEPGTYGWEYFLMLPVGDAERDRESPESDADETGMGCGERLRDSRSGVRSVEIRYIISRLKELGSLWHATKKKRKVGSDLDKTEEQSFGDNVEEEPREVPSSVEMYTHLFTHLLFPPTRIATEDYHDPYSLKVQILALIQALSKRVWLNFSDERWRIKLGQILWGNIESEEVELEDWEISSKESERVWLLLQILMACELVLRLNTVLSEESFCRGSTDSNQSTESMEQALHRFRQAGGLKVQWDMLLARRWLDNVRIVESDSKIQASPISKEPEQSSFLLQTSRWFTSQPFFEAPAPPTPDSMHVTDALLLPRHGRRQIEGLIHFARIIQWPNIDTLSQQAIAHSPLPALSIYGTPLPAGTPLSINSVAPSGSYFSSINPRPKRFLEAPGLHHRKPSILTVPTVAGVGGWLSRSYLTGFVLPGEGISHLIISTLLETDPEAFESLGRMANLYGGFQYQGKTWWSRYCIVGKVMAGCEGVGEECGWIGPVMRSGAVFGMEDDELQVGRIPDGWVDVVTIPALDGKTPRALIHRKIAKDADVRGRCWSHNAALGRDEFAEVEELKDDQNLVIRLRGLYFNPAEAHQQQTFEETGLAEFQSYDIGVHVFVGSPTGARALRVIDLVYDVSFVSAWPCYPREGSEAHLLHQSFKHKTLLLQNLEICYPSVSDTTKDTNDWDDTADKSVIVINVWSPQQRVFVGAWCANRGYNAIIARRGRTCTACAIREAFAIGLKVVIKV
jgi:hypothetical protein